MKKDDCIFCKIANKVIPAEFIVETDDYVAFKDVHPRSPVHVLVIPKEHFETLNEVNSVELLGKLLDGVKQVAKKLGVEDGYRTVINTGKKSGQEVFHVHLHLMAGRPFSWPPG